MQSQAYNDLLRRFAQSQNQIKRLCSDHHQLPPLSRPSPREDTDFIQKIKILDQSKLKTDRLTHQLLSAQSHIQIMSSRIAQLVSSTKDRQTIMLRQEARLKESEQQVSALKMALNNSQNKIKSSEQLWTFQKNQLQKNLQATREKYREIKRQKKTLKDHLAQLQGQSIRLKEKLTNLDTDLKRQSKEAIALRIQSQSFSEQLRSSQNTIKSLECELKRTNEMNSMRAQNRGWMQEKRLMSSEHQKAVAQKNQQIERLRKQLQRKRSKDKQKKQQLRLQLDETKKNAFGLQHQVTLLRTQNEQLAKEIQQHVQIQNNLRSELISVKDNLIRVKDQGRLLQDETVVLKVQLGSRESTIRNNQIRLQQLQNQNMKREFELQSVLKQTKLQSQKEIKMNHQLSELQAEIEQLINVGRLGQQKIILLEEEIRKLRDALQASQDKEQLARSQYEQLASQFKQALEQLRSKQNMAQMHVSQSRGRCEMSKLSRLRTLEQIRGLILSHKINSRPKF